MRDLRMGMAVLALFAFGAATRVQADVVTDWNDKACTIVGKAGGGATGHRLMAIVQVAVFETVNSIEPRYTPYVGNSRAPRTTARTRPRAMRLTPRPDAMYRR